MHVGLGWVGVLNVEWEREPVAEHVIHMLGISAGSAHWIEFLVVGVGGTGVWSGSFARIRATGGVGVAEVVLCVCAVREVCAVRVVVVGIGG